MTKVTHLTTDENGALNRRRIHLREISGDTDQPLGTVGQELRAARLRRGDDLATVSRALKIRKDHLDAIEEDKLEALPGRTYAVGFVRSYADFLGLDPVQAVERFKGEIAGRSDGTYQVALAPDSDERQLPHGWIVIAAVLLLIVGYGAYQLARSADMLLREPITPVPARIVPQAELARKPPVPVEISTPVQPQAQQSGGVGQPQANRAPGQTIQPIGGAPAGSVPGSEAQASGQPAIQQLAALPHGQEFGAQYRDSRVLLRAKTMTRVLVQGADGTVFINRMLHPGDDFRVPDRVGLTLTTPDGGAIAVELDGQVMGPAGSAGQVTEALSLDPQAIVDRYSGGRGAGR